MLDRGAGRQKSAMKTGFPISGNRFLLRKIQKQKQNLALETGYPVLGNRFLLRKINFFLVFQQHKPQAQTSKNGNSFISQPNAKV